VADRKDECICVVLCSCLNKVVGEVYKYMHKTYTSTSL